MNVKAFLGFKTDGRLIASFLQNVFQGRKLCNNWDLDFEGSGLQYVAIPLNFKPGKMEPDTSIANYGQRPRLILD